ncbi:DNA-protecting protein DprA [Candidatus Berkelbacteria bacterium]|uniref:DNA-protecting protein DprA n=1 Tax=Candidatus Berkelbacteria bacterium CG10_big_fil_rev_8_21_14_0_10_43_14 TaxID=1974515 RepID=A0A2M6R987_9BACT|nr:DNA-protecting protein DprA [Candidatus Berkelbacteria bacterium]PIS07066.1 MAG: DNA-protecting protein DprA [Candidatus Berkelbacteria bacterium CG10_big_fil_rev_8_21_14_0_10_43_14]PIU87290.1 MAG: DNA-protecting protein DprA [Candidatus Berkelbacteria bacterium CG06_land_8_20_14_3_00_43_10]
MNDRDGALALSQNITIGARTCVKLRALGKIGTVISLSAQKLHSIGFTTDVARSIADAHLIDIDAVKKQLQRFSINYAVFGDREYPSLLAELPDPPSVLYYKGTLASLAHPTVALVGSRKASTYGTFITKKLVDGLCQKGITIVSGLALGIDAVAHRSAVDAEGLTVAVLGNGLDTIYPSSHTRLAQSIIESGGCILSEYPVGTPSYPAHFPVRNRIIAGLSLGTVVVEAAHQSGSLHTAHAALDYNRDVMAVPHALATAGGEGPHSLIRAGATLVRTYNDILDVLGIADTPQQPHVSSIPLSQTDSAILSLLTKEPLHIDDIVVTSEYAIGDVSASLAVLEMSGHVRHIGGKRYSKVW